MADVHAWELLGGIEEAVLVVIGDHYGLYGRVLDHATVFREPMESGGLGSDDIDIMEVVLTLEELLDLYFPPFEIKSIVQIKDMLDLVRAGVEGADSE